MTNIQQLRKAKRAAEKVNGRNGNRRTTIQLSTLPPGLPGILPAIRRKRSYAEVTSGSTSTPTNISVDLFQNTKEVVHLEKLSNDNLHKWQDYIQWCESTGKTVKASTFVNPELFMLIKADLNEDPDAATWADWPNDRLCKALLQRNPPAGVQGAKPSLTARDME